MGTIGQQMADVCTEGAPCASQVLALSEKIKDRIDNLSDCLLQGSVRLVLKAVDEMQDSEDWALDQVQHFAMSTLMSLEKHLESTCTHGPRERPDANKLYADITTAIEAMAEGDEKSQRKATFDDMEAKL